MDADWLEARALHYVSRREASEARVAALLERKIAERCERSGESGDRIRSEIPSLIARLVDANFICDERFAQVSIDRLRRRGASREKIRANLLTKGISEALLDELFGREEAAEESRAAWRFAKRRLLGPFARNRRDRYEAQDDPESERIRAKELTAFGRQGFDFELAQTIVDADTARDAES